MSKQTVLNESSKGLFRRWWRFITIGIAIVLIVFILRSISLDELLQSLRRLAVMPLLVAFGLNIIVYLLMAFRWRILYAVVETPPAFLYLVKVTIVSVFFNTILPSVVGGDTYRMLQLRHYADTSSNLEHSFAIVFVDRVVGLVGLIMFGCIGMLLNSTAVSFDVAFITVLLLLVLLAILNMSMHYGAYATFLKFLRWLPSKQLKVVEQTLNRIYQNISIYRSHRTLLVQAIVLSLLLRFFWFIAGYYVGLSLSLDVPLIMFIVFLPIIEIIRMIPLTIQGIGVREGLFILFFGTVGVTNSDAVLLATLIYLMATVVGIVGGFIYLGDNLLSVRLQK